MLTRKSAILYLSLVFIAGAVAGGAGGYYHAKNTPRRPPELPKGNPADWMAKGLKDRIGLTDAQVEQIKPIMAKHLARMDDCRKQREEEITSIFLEMNQEMGPVLTDDQRVKLAELEKSRQEWSIKRMQGGFRSPKK